MNIQQKEKRVDYLSVRLRRIVRSLIETERAVTPLTWIGFLKSKQYHLFTKVLKIVALAMCVAVFLFQIHDRILYYQDYPVSTDVFIVRNTDEVFPDITICHDPNNGTRQLFRELGLPKKTCNKNVAERMTKRQRNIGLEEMWKRLTSANDLFSAKVVGLQNSTTESLNHSNVYLLYGICETFHGNSTTPGQNNERKLEITFSERLECVNEKAECVYLHEPNEHPMSRYEHGPLAGHSNHVKTSIRKYKFQNRTLQPCISGNDYATCERECFIKFSKERRNNCRLPFQPRETGLPECGSGNVYGYWKNLKRYLRRTVNDSCTCTRKCSHRVFDNSIEGLKSQPNQTKFVIEFGNAHITIISERFVYTFVNLLADIGGNSGLWIGLSLLSMFSFLPECKRPKKGQFSFSVKDPLLRIVNRRLRKDLKVLKYNNSDHSSKKVKFVVIGITSILFAAALFNRIDLFFQYKVRNLVDIVFLQNIYSPSVTICPGDTDLQNLQKTYAKQNNISDLCKVQTWQLLSLPHTSALFLWTNNNKSEDKMKWIPATAEYLHEGVCFNTLHREEPVTALDMTFGLTAHETLCGENYMKVYIKPPTGFYDYSLYSYATSGQKHSISYVVKRISPLQTEEECVDESKHEECKASCFTRKLWQRINCWLPFMPPSNLSLCDSPTSAHHSLQAYLQLVVFPQRSADCNCFPPCFKDIYDVGIESEKWKFKGFSFGFGARHNILEIYSQVRIYSVVALLCDVGGWLGSTLGFCIFGVFDILIERANKLIMRIGCRKNI